MGKLLQVISPGRTEIAGNHTDHEGGHVIAAALDRAIIGTFEERDDLIARVESEGREPFEIDLASTDARDDAMREIFRPLAPEVMRKNDLLKQLAELPEEDLAAMLEEYKQRRMK